MKSDTQGEMVEEGAEGWQAFPLNSFQVWLETRQAFSQSNSFSAFLRWSALEMHVPSLTKCKHPFSHSYETFSQTSKPYRASSLVSLITKRNS